MNNPIEEGKVRQASELQGLLDHYRDRRVVVVGTTCTGKSTFLQRIQGSHDMDKLVFPTLSKEEREYVTQTPWTPEIGKTMIRLVRERVKVKPGEPVFGTIVIPSDLIVYLKISDGLLRERTASRKKDFQDAKNMQAQIEEEIVKSGIPSVEFDVG